MFEDEVLQIKTKDDVRRKPVIVPYSLDPFHERGEELVAFLQKSLDAKDSDPMPRPIVQLVRNSNSEAKVQDIVVEANRLMHAELRKALRAFDSSATD